MFWDRYVSLCSSKGMKPQPAGLQAGIKSGTISGWKKNAEEGQLKYPECDKLLLLANFFNCSVDYLLERTDVIEVGGPANAEVLDEEEIELIQYFRKLERVGRRHVLICAEDEAKAAEKGTGETSTDRLA